MGWQGHRGPEQGCLQGAMPWDPSTMSPANRDAERLLDDRAHRPGRAELKDIGFQLFDTLPWTLVLS